MQRLEHLSHDLSGLFTANFADFTASHLTGDLRSRVRTDFTAVSRVYDKIIVRLTIGTLAMALYQTNFYV